jgi:hypothetical protein
VVRTAVNGNGSSLDIVYLANGSERERHQNGTCWNGNGVEREPVERERERQ